MNGHTALNKFRVLLIKRKSRIVYAEFIRDSPLYLRDRIILSYFKIQTTLPYAGLFNKDFCGLDLGLSLSLQVILTARTRDHNSGSKSLLTEKSLESLSRN